MIKLKNLYLENTRIDKMYCNGDLIYQSLIKPVFSLSTDELIIETGQTVTFDITANDSWTISAPEWVTISQSSGYGNTTISVTMGLIVSAGTIDVTCYNQTKTISVSTRIDYSEKYLTFRVIGNGVIKWVSSSSSNYKTISYSKDNGNTWNEITSNRGSSAPTISVSAGDTVIFKGNNSTYSFLTLNNTSFNGSTAQFDVEGNIMSLIYGDNFSGQTTLENTYNFFGFFTGCTGLTSAENLILPATTLTTGCYRSMFRGCTSLTTAPELPATTLVSYCYRDMFYACTSLNYVKCLATSGINTSNSTNDWLNSVSSTGTFVKKSGVTSWPSGTSGIPSGWTVIEE